MPTESVQIGDRLNETTALQLATDLNLLDPESDVVLDFSRTTHFEPFGMLLTIAAVSRLRRRIAQAGRTLTIPEQGIDPEGIAGHMGFWRSIGVPIGREINAESRKETYLPITQISVSELYQESGGSNPVASGIVERR